jgi:4Fe-4S single cluster domain of Ferredoxin I
VKCFCSSQFLLLIVVDHLFVIVDDHKQCNALDVDFWLAFADCDTCRWMAPQVYSRVNGASAVVCQPESADSRQLAFQALLSCPTASIGVRHKEAGELRAAHDSLPSPVAECSGIYYAGKLIAFGEVCFSFYTIRALRLIPPAAPMRNKQISIRGSHSWNWNICRKEGPLAVYLHPH